MWLIWLDSFFTILRLNSKADLYKKILIYSQRNDRNMLAIQEEAKLQKAFRDSSRGEDVTSMPLEMNYESLFTFERI